MIGARPASGISQCVALPFEQRLRSSGLWPITALTPSVIQMNLGYRCNQRCAHCHIEAGPDRTEEMSQAVIQAALRFAATAGICEFDLTGGAPELNPRFPNLICSIAEQGGTATLRCNLTVLGERNQEDLPDFLAAHRVRITASLPHYAPDTTDRVRGAGAFDCSLAGLRALNAVGYGDPASGLELTLVVNPSGAFLPAPQAALEADFRTQLLGKFGITFTRLITLTNMPIGRFLRFLVKSGNLPGYMRRLADAFNPATVPFLMCRHTLSVAWDGRLYDCDFNQAAGLQLGEGRGANIEHARIEELPGRPVRCADYCYACTAGAGSSCRGAVAA